MESISFIILTWNSEKYIYSCLNSIYSIDNIEKEVIIIDNGSEDQTRSIIKREFANVKLIELDKNFGTTYTRNLGIKASNNGFEYICILDADTVINEYAIYNLIECLKSNTKYMIAVPLMKNLKGELQLSAKRFPTLFIKVLKALPLKHFNRKGSDLETISTDGIGEIVEVDYAISACWLMKREVIRLVGFLDEKYFYAPEDVDYCATIWKQGGKVVLATNSIIIHDTQRISKKRLISKMNLIHIKGLVYYFFKHKYCFSTWRLYKKINEMEKVGS